MNPIDIDPPPFDPSTYDFSLAPSTRRKQIITPGGNFVQRFLDACRRPVHELTEHHYIALPCGEYAWIPKGFLTDLASTPRPLFVIPGMSPNGVLMKGSLPHDFAYRHNALLNHRGQWIYVESGQKVFDILMRDINIRDEGAKIPATVGYGALRVVGRFAWNNARNRETGRLNLQGEYV